MEERARRVSIQRLLKPQEVEVGMTKPSLSTSGELKHDTAPPPYSPGADLASAPQRRRTSPPAGHKAASPTAAAPRTPQYIEAQYIEAPLPEGARWAEEEGVVRRGQIAGAGMAAAPRGGAIPEVRRRPRHEVLNIDDD